MADEDSENEIRRALESVQSIQSIIDISADRLDGLRIICATNAKITQQEIRTLEGKLIKLFSKQLVAKSKIPDKYMPSNLKHRPSIKQWLLVVGLGPESIKNLCSKVKTFEALQEKSDHELRKILTEKNFNGEELRRLTRALYNLKTYTQILQCGEPENVDLPLYWDSWDSHKVVDSNFKASPRHKIRGGRCSIPSEETLGSHLFMMGGGPLSPPIPSCNSSTPPPTPPFLKMRDSKLPTTPPPYKKQNAKGSPTSLLPDNLPLTKSKSHESQLGIRIDNDHKSSGRGRLPTEPGPTGGYSPLQSSPVRMVNSSESPQHNDYNYSKRKNSSSLQVPKSPSSRVPASGIMGHVIAHRFNKTFQVMTTCDYCFKQMFIGTGLKCGECKYKCHKDCERHVPPSCGLPPELIREFQKTLEQSDRGVLFPNLSPKFSRPAPSYYPGFGYNRVNPRTSVNIPPFPGGPDSSSTNSSCNSSTPSSPAVQTFVGQSAKQFQFPDVVTLETHPLEISEDSDRTMSVSGSDSDRTPIRVDSQDSQVSDSDPSDRHWPRQNSLSMREWDIPFDELKMGESIGTGHFGTVYRGHWHGDVAVKLLDMNCMNSEKILEAFKLEVATFRKTRHENLVLFMGACMKPPRLAIVTSMCKGMTLYTHIHLCKDKFSMNKTTIVAQQISQGMGYLHARGIVHKDLKSRNIFLENGKVVITDFGIFSVTKLCFGNKKGDGLSIPPGWLCYLSPEIIRNLRVHQRPEDDELPFSKESDVYAFGTVWYELLCGEWPLKSQPPESLIWQVGIGMKQPLANLQASRDVKDILMLCWSYRPEERPDFTQLLTTLEKLPRKRLGRSPSHPIHLSRSAESVF